MQLPRRKAVTIVLALAPAAALAQDFEPNGRIDGHGFVLSAYDGNPRDLYGMTRMTTFEGGDWFVGGVLEFAKAPVVYRSREVDGSLGERSRVLDNVLALNVSGGGAVHERVRLDASVPVYVTSSGLDGGQGAALGDVRIGGLVGIVLPKDASGYGLGVVPWLDLPTGAQAKWLGNGGLGGGFVVANTFEADKLTVSGNIGMGFRPAVSDLENLDGADSLLAGLAMGYLINDENGVNLESRIAVPFSKNARPGAGTPGEWMLSYRHHHDSGGHFGVGFGTAFTRGASAAAWRVVVGGGFGRPQRVEKAPADRDNDGIVDDLDACPDEPETVNQYLDEDGCPDALTSVVVKTVGPDGAEIRDAGAYVNWGDSAGEYPTPIDLNELVPGTPIKVEANYLCLTGSASGEAVAQPSELVVDLKPVVEGSANLRVVDDSGTPVDNAVATWLTDVDACVEAGEIELGRGGTSTMKVGAGTHTLKVRAEGYAPNNSEHAFGRGETQDIEVVLKRVAIEKREIVTFDKVYFEYDRAVIQKKSYKLLDDVAKIILDNPDFGRVEVAGHTDSDGNAAYNKRLSQLRAEAVRKYLIGKGIAASRLLAKGYGEENLVVSPEVTKEDKARNRRVNFVLVDMPEADAEEGIEVKPK